MMRSKKTKIQITIALIIVFAALGNMALRIHGIPGTRVISVIVIVAATLNLAISILDYRKLNKEAAEIAKKLGQKEE